MPDGVTRYPLSWPVGWKRTAPAARRAAQFSRREQEYHTRADGSRYSYSVKKDLSVFDATRRLSEELARLIGDGKPFVLSTNMELRQDGMPRSDRRAPADPGAALYFKLRGQDRCLACDRYTTVAGNIAAIAAHIEALRAIERYGVGTLDQAFAGYTALPSRVDDAIAWWDVLRIERSKATPETVAAAFRALALTHHPDRGGNTELMTKITLARDAALRELRGEK